MQTHRVRRLLALLAVAVLGLTSWTGTARSQDVALAGREPRFLQSVSSSAAPVEIDAGRSAMLRRLVSLNFAEPTVGKLLGAIEQQTGLKFAYKLGRLSPDRQVELQAQRITVAAALTAILLDTDLDVLLTSGDHVVLVDRLPRAPAPLGSIVGQVTDAKTHTALAGATVTVDGTKHVGTTGNDGRYRIAEVTPGMYTVRARYIGYAPGTASVAVRADQEATADFALQKSAQQLDQLVVTGTETPTAVRALPTPISVVTADQIAAQHVQRVDQLFRGEIPGIFAPESGSASDFDATINVRGGSSVDGIASIKTYIDGVEVTEPLFITMLDPNSIARVEVIRGPQASTIYGSDALNGVLQIFTKTGQLGAKPRLDAMLSGGVQQTKWSGKSATDQQDYSASLSGGGPGFSYSVGGGRIHTGEWFQEYSNTGNSLYGSVKGTSGPVTAELSGRYYHLTEPQGLLPVFEPYAGPPFYRSPVDQDLLQRSSTFGLTLTYRVSPRWTHAVTIGYDRFGQDIAATRARHTTPRDTLVTLITSEDAKASVRYNTTLTVPLGGSLSAVVTAGADYYQRLETDFFVRAPSLTGTFSSNAFGFGDRTDFHNAGYFAQTQLNLGEHLFATAGLRAEDNANFGQDFGLAWAPRLGLAYVRNVGDVTVKARGSWGKAIRPPSQGKSEGGTTSFRVTLPNPVLGPESQKGWDAGVELYYRDVLSLQATYYRQAVEGLIDGVLLQPGLAPALPVYQNQNVGRVNNRGWELEASTSPVTGLTLAGTYSITTSQVAALSPAYTGALLVGDQLLSVPLHTAGARVSYRLGRASATLGMTHSSSFTNTDWVPFIASLFGVQPFRASDRDYWTTYPGFEKYRLNVAYEMTPQVTLFVDVKNLTNNYVDEFYNLYPAKGRMIMAGVHANLGLGR